MIGRGNRSTRRKPAPVPLCPPQNPHAARTRTRAVAVGSQCLTAELRHGLLLNLQVMVRKRLSASFLVCNLIFLKQWNFKIVVFLDMTPFILVNIYLNHSSTLQMEAVSFSEMSVNIYQVARCSFRRRQ
jgi:hypothetical protein